MPRTLTKEKPIRQRFVDELITAVSSAPSKQDVRSQDWREQPVSLEEFCEKMIGEALFPEQLKFAQAVLGDDQFEFSDQYDEGHAFWGKGSGKDLTVAKIQAYTIYKLLCLKNPQRFLRERYGCSIGEGDNIDVANMSINARQAENVYFKKFKAVIKRTVNPKTGRKWFAERGVDLRDGYDLQTTEVRFPENITAHSLNSETNTGEGLSLLLVTIDEFGAFRPFQKAFDLLEAVRSSVVSRFPRTGTVCVISYKYYHNDPMDVLFRQGLDDPRIYSSRKSTWDVNVQRNKGDFSRAFSKNPEKARMTYECEGGEQTGGYVSKKYMLSHLFSPDRDNPVKGDLTSVDTAFLGNLVFKSWFKPIAGTMYCVHVDLSKGKDSGDSAGVAMAHVEKMFPQIDEKLKRDLYKEGYNIEITDGELAVARKGVVIDLALQLVSRTDEIQLADVRGFILRLKREGFNIFLVTYDGWQSLESIQMLRQAGMDAQNLSVDKDSGPYETWKELMYQQLVKAYPHSIAHREARELIIDPTSGKIDHPEMSYERERTEGKSKGSKDVMDGIVGATKTAYERLSIEPDVFFG